jgi:hypothetical protein
MLLQALVKHKGDAGAAHNVSSGVGVGWQAAAALLEAAHLKAVLVIDH